MLISGWGNYPKIDANIFKVATTADLKSKIVKNRSFITYGMGRSYGDCALSENIVDLSRLNKIKNFDENTGELEVYAGVSIEEILEFVIPKGWFIPVTPGTKYVSVAGAISNDVHGKNHHKHGCFSNYVDSFELILPDNSVNTCSRDKNTELFQAVCGGVGLIGVIITARLKLIPIKSSYIDTVEIKCRTLEETVSTLKSYKDSTYSVAWLDCLSKNKLGRGVVYIGEHSKGMGLETSSKHKVSVPQAFPSFLLNYYTTRLFNGMLYNKSKRKKTIGKEMYDSFFYPLDNLKSWNNMYGAAGFLQYQFVIPYSAGLEGLRTILEFVARSKRGSFLSVLKILGGSNKNLLSFPIEGFTLAMDFKLEKGVKELLTQLDKMVLGFGGRLYLAKDARMEAEVFKASYPNWKEFVRIRKELGADIKFNSIQSKRLGI